MSFAFGPLQTIPEDEAFELVIDWSWAYEYLRALRPWDPIEALPSASQVPDPVGAAGAEPELRSVESILSVSTGLGGPAKKRIRYYAKERALFCDQCGCLGRFLYACTADTPDFSAFEPELPPRDSTILEPWVQKAIAEGQYTDAQIRTLVNNKMDVLVTAALQRNHDSRQGTNSSSRPEEKQQSVPEWISIARRLQFDTGQDCSGPIDTSRMTCQVRVCAMCHSDWAECARESINTMANEPYRPPPHIPEILSRPTVRVVLASGLPTQDVNDWQTTLTSKVWWRAFSKGVEYELESSLSLAKSMALSFSQFQKLMDWVVSRNPTKQRAEDTIRWVQENQNNPSQASHFRQNLADSRRMLPRIIRQPLKPERSIISRPVWEEAESQGELMETPGWEYSDWSRCSARDRASHRRNTERFSRARGMSNR
ncbi:hypothetical protein N7486_006772 [Penicillium sp. IBT 16267x]|nr:hypothetical protein N7486_006772 [Penicillium sp. IBT 16267x]